MEAPKGLSWLLANSALAAKMAKPESRSNSTGPRGIPRKSNGELLAASKRQRPRAKSSTEDSKPLIAAHGKNAKSHLPKKNKKQRELSAQSQLETTERPSSAEGKRNSRAAPAGGSQFIVGLNEKAQLKRQIEQVLAGRASKRSFNKGALRPSAARSRGAASNSLGKKFGFALTKKPTRTGLAPFPAVLSNPAPIGDASSEASKRAAQTALEFVRSQDVLRWLQEWGNGFWYSSLKSVESALIEVGDPPTEGEEISVANSEGKEAALDWQASAAVGQAALSHLVAEYRRLLLTDSEQRWLLTNAGEEVNSSSPASRNVSRERRSGSQRAVGGGASSARKSEATLSDRISSLTMLVQQAPLCGLKFLHQLVRVASQSNRSAAFAVLAALEELFAGPLLLPSFRKIRVMSQQSPWLVGRVAKWLPVLLKSTTKTTRPKKERGKPDAPEGEDDQEASRRQRALTAVVQLLLLWKFEESLAHAFSLFVAVSGGERSLLFLRERRRLRGKKRRALSSLPTGGGS